MDWNTGILEWWNNGAMDSKPSTPIFPYSNTPFRSSASEIFLSSPQIAWSAEIFDFN
jgi:hypothetical protein